MSIDKLPTAPTPEKAPDPLELFKQWLYELFRRWFGTRGAAVFLVLVALVARPGEVANAISYIHTRVVEWMPLPTAKPDVFTMAIARLEGDDGKADMESTIAQDLRDLEKSNGIAVLEFPRTISADSDDDVQTGHAKARKWLTESGAQVLIWGKVVTAGGKSVPQLYWTPFENSNPKKPSGRYVLGEDLRLPPVFQSDLSDILRLLVVTQSSAFDAEEGHFVADRLRPFIERTRRLLEGDATKTWGSENIALTKLILGNALRTVGEQSGENPALSNSIDLYNGALEGFPRQQHPLEWALIQNNLGVALRELSEREPDAKRLTEAVAACQAALEERTEARVPLSWAMTQNNLGAALRTLGERESGTQHLTEGVAAYYAALKEWTRARVPLYWAATQNNLGNALAALGQREPGTQHLTEAVAAYRAALEERTRARVPLDWATTQSNLGATLDYLGVREPGTKNLTEAVAAYRAALEEQTLARVPLEWATAQNNLGNALTALGDREPATQHLTEAVAAFRAALQERTHARVPLDWAQTENNLGVALDHLGDRESDSQHLAEAVDAYRAALEEYTLPRVPLDWAITRNNLGNAIRDLGTRASDPIKLCQALEDHISAWQVFSEVSSYYASRAVTGAQHDVDAIHGQPPAIASPCVQIYAAELKRMGVVN